MSKRFFVGSRKGLFSVERTASGWRIGQPSFVGDPVNIVFPDRRDGTLYAALPLGHFGVKLRRSDDGGQTWDECPVPRYDKVPDAESVTATSESGPASDAGNSPSSGPSLEEIWALEGGGSDRPGQLWCGTIPGGLFHSDDRGDSWQLVESLWDLPERDNWFGGGKDHPGIHSVCVDPRNSDHVTVGVSCGGIWQTQDAGRSWALRAAGMRAAYMPPDRAFDPTIQDPHLIVQCRDQPDHFWVQHHNGIFRSDDNCASWSECDQAAPSGFGFAVAVHPADGRRAWFVPAVKDECRVPVDGRLVVTTTENSGETFRSLSAGLPGEPAWDIVFRHALAIDDSGECLAMGSSTGGLWVSEDAGESWTCLSSHLPQIYCVRFE